MGCSWSLSGSGTGPVRPGRRAAAPARSGWLAACPIPRLAGGQRHAARPRTPACRPWTGWVAAARRRSPQRRSRGTSLWVVGERRGNAHAAGKPRPDPGRQPMTRTAGGSVGWWGAARVGRPGLRVGVGSAVVTSGPGPLGATGPPARSTVELGRARRLPLGLLAQQRQRCSRSVPYSIDCPAAVSEARGPSLPALGRRLPGHGLSRWSRPARFLPGRRRQVARAPRGRGLRQRGALLAAGIGGCLHGLGRLGRGSPSRLGGLLNKVRWRIGLGPGGVVGQRRLPILVPAGPLQQGADVAMHPTQILQQPIAELPHLLRLGIQRRPLLLHL